MDWREGRRRRGKRVVQEVTAEGVVRGKKEGGGTEARGGGEEEEEGDTLPSMNHDTEADLEAQKLYRCWLPSSLTSLTRENLPVRVDPIQSYQLRVFFIVIKISLLTHDTIFFTKLFVLISLKNVSYRSMNRPNLKQISIQINWISLRYEDTITQEKRVCVWEIIKVKGWCRRKSGTELRRRPRYQGRRSP